MIALCFCYEKIWQTFDGMSTIKTAYKRALKMSLKVSDKDMCSNSLVGVHLKKPGDIQTI